MKTQIAFLGKQINMAPRAHRRWLVVATYASFAAFIVAVFWFSQSLIYAWCLITVTVVMIMVSSLIGRRTGTVDEREAHRWDYAQARTYRTLGGVFVLALFAGYFRGPNPITPLVGEMLRTFLEKMQSELLMAAAVLYITLPAAILLWTEPDMDPDQERIS